MGKRTILPVEHLSKDTQGFFDVLNGEKDLPAILVAASYLDACLASILKRRLLKSSVTDQLLEPNGPLGAISARASLCYCLGLIKKELYQDLIIITRIRNEVAHHHLELRFSEPTIADLCSQLGYAASLKNGNTDEPLVEESWIHGPRNQFTIAVIMISQRLLIIGLGINEEDSAV